MQILWNKNSTSEVRMLHMGSINQKKNKNKGKTKNRELKSIFDTIEQNQHK